MIVLSTVTVNLPSKLKIPPIPLVKKKVAECFIMSKKPFTAAVQKFSPVRTT